MLVVEIIAMEVVRELLPTIVRMHTAIIVVAFVVVWCRSSTLILSKNRNILQVSRIFFKENIRARYQRSFSPFLRNKYIKGNIK